MKDFSKTQKIFLIVLGLFIGFFAGAFGLFQILFLFKVIPHGGI